jgi:nitroreductase
MNVLKVISANPLAAVLFITAFSVALTYLLAFFQGRALSFWPPRIEGKPIHIHPNENSPTSVMDAIRTRKSVRAFLDKLVEDEKLNRILEAGRLAPSASNRQEWRFVIVRQPETRKKLAGAVDSTAAFVGKGPVIIAACADTDGHSMKCGQLCYPIDVAIALDHMTLAAVELGLGTCWIGMFEEKRVRKILGIPERIRVVALMPLGYPADPSPIEKKRLPMNRIVKYEHWY